MLHILVDWRAYSCKGEKGSQSPSPFFSLELNSTFPTICQTGHFVKHLSAYFTYKHQNAFRIEFFYFSNCCH